MVVSSEIEGKLQRIPTVGETIKFFDDGKSDPSRRYWAIILEILPCWKIRLFHPKLYRAWKRELKEAHWLYAKKTDYFIKAKVDQYSEIPCYFVRTKNGGWFSLDYPNWWMSGALDVEDELWNHVKNENERFI